MLIGDFPGYVFGVERPAADGTFMPEVMPRYAAALAAWHAADGIDRRWRCRMDQRVSLITLGVRDLDRARAFYERLGWKRAFFGAEGVVFFQTGGMALALYPRRDLAKDAGVDEAGLGPAAAVTLALNVRGKAEVDTALAEAEAAGARITMPAREVFWGGYVGHFADPEGFLWELAWNPGFHLKDDGSVVLPD